MHTINTIKDQLTHLGFAADTGDVFSIIQKMWNAGPGFGIRYSAEDAISTVFYSAATPYYSPPGACFARAVVLCARRSSLKPWHIEHVRDDIGDQLAEIIAELDTVDDDT